jgi:ABC-2 type transport system permease protein
MKGLTSALRAMPTLLRIGFYDAVAYRAEFFVWILAYTMPIIMLALWSAVAREAPVGEYGEREFQAYFLVTLVVRLATGSWVFWDINTEIRQGTLQTRLMRPIHPLLTYLAENLGAMPMRLVVVVPILIGITMTLGASIFTQSGVQLSIVAPSLLGAFLLQFFTLTTIGALAFFWESSMAVFDLWLGLYTVLSGYVMPLALFPERYRRIIDFLPFRQMLAFPVENILGTISPSRALFDLGLQWAWVAFLVALSHYVFRLGLKRFSAYGG